MNNETNSAGLPVIRDRHVALKDETAELVALIEQRDHARAVFAHMEEREERKTQTLAKVREYMQAHVGEWATGDVALDVLAIIDAGKDEL